MPRSFTTPTGLVLTAGDKIGSGSFGVARIVYDRKTAYCLKEVSVPKHDNQAKAEALKEVQLMKLTRNHPNIIHYYESWFSRDFLYILMEYAPNGSLDRLIKRFENAGRRFTETKVQHYCEELAGALHHCHNHLNLMHRDLKPENVLIDELGSLKLADFGLSTALSGSMDMASTFCGSPLYLAPEQCTVTHTYTFAVDMWALGCVLYEIMALTSPWTGCKTVPAVMHKILHSEPDFGPLRSSYPKSLVHLTRWMLQRKPSNRATAKEVAEHLKLKAPPNGMGATVREPPTPYVLNYPPEPTACHLPDAYSEELLRQRQIIQQALDLQRPEERIPAQEEEPPLKATVPATALAEAAEAYREHKSSPHSSKERAKRDASLEKNPRQAPHYHPPIPRAPAPMAPPPPPRPRTVVPRQSPNVTPMEQAAQRLQTAMRVSLNRKAPRRALPNPAAPLPAAKPGVSPLKPRLLPPPTDIGPCPSRIEALAKPRAPVAKPKRAAPALPRQAPPGTPRQAWM